MKGRCEYVKDDGERCRLDSGLEMYEGELRCLWHDPNRREKAMAARRRGGKASRSGGGSKTVNPYDAPQPPQSLKDAVEWASWVTWAVTVGELDVQVSYAAMNALRTFIKASEKVDTADLWTEVEALREKLEEAVAA